MPRRDPNVLYIELSLPRSHPVARRIVREAADRDVTVHQHIKDLLVAREKALNGENYADLVAWLPPAPAAPRATPPLADPTPPKEAPGAASAAAFWARQRKK